MKIKFISTLFFVVAILLVFSFESDKEYTPIQKIETKYHADYELLRAETRQFVNLLNDESSDLKDLKGTYFKMRKAFKSIEHLWSFLDREFVTKYINGAPLPKVEPNAPDLKIIQPKGLQCIDEALFAESIDRSELIGLSKQMLNRMQPFAQTIGLRDQQFFDASKLAVIRLAYVSASGFDVPASLTPFVDMQSSLDALAFGYKSYTMLFRKNKKQLDLLDTVILDIARTKKFISAQDNFQKLDRVSLIRNYLNPLFSAINTFHKASGFETYYETTSQRLGVNLLAKNLITDELLDKDFFFSFPDDVDSSQLVSLGKILFYDPVLSSSLSVSCASCHNPKLGFSDGVVKSVTHHGKDTVDRNAPGLLNSVYAEKYFYDLRTENLINQIEHVVISEKEMGTNPMDLTKKLNFSKDYKELFTKAFQSSDISYQKVALALASYVSSLTDFNTEMDQYLLKKKDTVSPSIYKGMNIFYGKGQCATCHFGPTYSGLVPPFYIETESEVLGVPNHKNKSIAKADEDIGRFVNMKQQTDFYKGSFKTTTARNVKHTAPYMHNGVFSTLDELVDFYNDGGGNGWGFKLEHQTLASDALDLTENEKKNLIAFLNALTTDVSRFQAPKSLPKFEEPFTKWNQRLAY